MLCTLRRPEDEDKASSDGRVKIIKVKEHLLIIGDKSIYIPVRNQRCLIKQSNSMKTGKLETSKLPEKRRRNQILQYLGLT